jgi:signal transduction histidine kinase/CheY-like chemotaxis protein
MPHTPTRDLSAARLDELSPGRFLAGWVQTGALITLGAYGAIVGSALIWGTGGPYDPTTELGVLCAAAFALVLARRDHTGLAAFALLTAVWLELMVSIAGDGGYQSKATIALPLIVFATGMLLGGRWAWGVAIASSLGSLALMKWLGMPLAAETSEIDAQRYFIIISATLLATAALVQLALATFARVVETARQGELRAARLVDEAPDGILMLDSSFRILHMNPTAESILSGGIDVFHGRTISDLLAPRRPGHLEHVFRQILDDPAAAGPLRVTSATRPDQVLEVTARRRPDATSEDPRGTVQMMLRDVSRQAALEDRAARLGRILEEAGNEVLVFERDSGRIVLLSRGARRNLGIRTGRVPASIEKINPALGPEGRARLCERVGELGGAPYRAKGAHRRPGGEMYPVEVEYLAGQLDDTDVLIAFAVDVSDRERAREQQEKLQTQLQHAQRMEAIGHLAGGVAHDFNNLLTVIALCGSELRDVVPEGASHLVDDLLEAQTAGKQLTRQLLAFAREDVVRPESIGLGESVGASMSLLRRLVGAGFVVELDAEPEVRVFADRGQIEQILINLVANARDAMQESGRIDIAVDRVDDAEGTWARLRVSDTGAGMPREVSERVFEPFFTTKEVGKGTGLGLSTVHGIVVQNGGRIEVESVEGEGTTFEVRWPIDESECIEERCTELDDEVPSIHGATILVAEDNEVAGTLFRRALEQEGHRVLLTVDGKQGLEVGRKHMAEIDLVLTDVVMPEISGPDMMRELRSLGLDVPVLFVSGYLDGNLQQVEEDGRADILMKPFRATELVSRVNRLLRDGGSRVTVAEIGAGRAE